MSASMAIFLARIRLPAVALFLGLSIANWFLPVLPGGWACWLASLAVIAVLLRAGTLRREPVAVRLPVDGPWRARTAPRPGSPATGSRATGRRTRSTSFYDPADPAHPRPRFGWRPRPGARETSPGSASRYTPRPTGWWCASTIASATTGAGTRPSACSTRSPSSCCASDRAQPDRRQPRGHRPRRRRLRRPGPSAPPVDPGHDRTARPRRRPDRRVRQLRQHHRAAPAFPAHGSSQRCRGRRLALPFPRGRRHSAGHPAERPAAPRVLSGGTRGARPSCLTGPCRRLSRSCRLRMPRIGFLILEAGGGYRAAHARRG